MYTLLQAGGQGSQQTWGSSTNVGQQQQQYVAYPIPGMGGASHAPPPPPPTQAEVPPTATDSGSVQSMRVHVAEYICCVS